MSHVPHIRTLFPLTLILCLLIVIASVGGILFEEQLYALEAPYYVAQLIGTDIANLLLVVPTLLVSVLLMRRSSARAYFVWSGTMMFAVYISLSYCLTLHFNRLFLVYCAILGLSFHLLLTPLVTLDAEKVREWFVQGTKTTAVIIYLLVLMGLMYVLELSEAIPALIAGSVPPSAAMSGLITSPFHVLDLALFFPGFLISAFLLYKKRALGYLLAPSFLGFSLTMTLALTIMVILIAMRGFGLEVDSLAIFGVTTIVCGAILARFLRYCSGE